VTPVAFEHAPAMRIARVRGGRRRHDLDRRGIQNIRRVRKTTDVRGKNGKVRCAAEPTSSGVVCCYFYGKVLHTFLVMLMA
jgi:hypothetical protein